MKYPKIIILLGFLLCVISACHSREQELAFESIAQGNFTNIQEKKTSMFVIASNDEIETLFPNASVEEMATSDQLQQLDYDQYFAILVLEGSRGEAVCTVTVQHISRRDDRIIVEVAFTETAIGRRTTQLCIFPYHLIAVSKQGEWGEKINFILINKSTTIAETSIFIP